METNILQHVQSEGLKAYASLLPRGGTELMVQMLGDRLLPEAVQIQRRKLRNRLTDLREPIRQRRKELVPGPDIMGSLEGNMSDIRGKVVDRTTVLERIRGGDDGSEAESEPAATEGQSREDKETMV